MMPTNKTIADFPNLVAEWHPTKNAPLEPEEITSGVNKKLWWQCPLEKDHVWQASVANRVRGAGCPFCSGRKVSKQNNLEVMFPAVAAQWHPEKNGLLQPSDVTYGSGKRVWWQCVKHLDHQWSARVCSRTAREPSNKSGGCPFCDGKLISYERSLESIFPKLSEQWDADRNGSLSASAVTPGSGKKVWWLCQKGHSWKATVSDRSQGHGCPQCSNQSSSPEIRLFAELKYIFDEVEYRHRLGGWEIDILLPKLNIGIEYDGAYYHKNHQQRDQRKKGELGHKLNCLLRVRCSPLPLEDDNDISVKTDEITKVELDLIASRIEPYCEMQQRRKIKAYLSKSSFQNEGLYQEYRSNLPAPVFEGSLAYRWPTLAEEWHLKKNGALRPHHFSPGSNYKAWWICVEGCEYEQTIQSRTSRGSGCPFCKGKKVGHGNSLKNVNFKLAAEWHPNLNGSLGPENVTAGSKKRVWWLCAKGHKWQQTVNGRQGGQRGCPYCTGHRFCEENSLSAKFPEIAKEWHPTKNGDLRPQEVTAGNKKHKVWWVCHEGHEWMATIGNRTGRGSGCPKCFDLYKRGRRNRT